MGKKVRTKQRNGTAISTVSAITRNDSIKTTANKHHRESSVLSFSSTSSIATVKTTTTTPPQVSVLLKKVRHSNTQIQHAALSALSLHISTCSRTTTTTSNDNHPNNRSHTISNNAQTVVEVDNLITTNTELLQAVREQIILNKDEYCVTAAASCLYHYILYVADASADGVGTTTHNSVNEMTAGWLLVFIARLTQQIKSIKNEIDSIILNKDHVVPNLSNHRTKNNATTKQQSKIILSLSVLIVQLEVCEQLLSCIVQLIETNPTSMDRLISSISLRDDCMRAISDLLRTCLEFLVVTSSLSISSAASSNVITANVSQPKHHSPMIQANEGRQTQEDETNNDSVFFEVDNNEDKNKDDFHHPSELDDERHENMEDESNNNEEDEGSVTITGTEAMTITTTTLNNKDKKQKKRKKKKKKKVKDHTTNDYSATPLPSSTVLVLKQLLLSIIEGSCRFFHSSMDDSNIELIEPYITDLHHKNPKTSRNQQPHQSLSTSFCIKQLVQCILNHPILLDSATSKPSEVIATKSATMHAIGANIAVWLALNDKQFHLKTASSETKELVHYLSCHINQVYVPTIRNFIHSCVLPVQVTDKSINCKTEMNSNDANRDATATIATEIIVQVTEVVDNVTIGSMMVSFPIAIRKLCEIHAHYMKQLDDDRLERDVIATIQKKQEPSRSIARRHKMMTATKGVLPQPSIMEQDDDDTQQLQQDDDDIDDSISVKKKASLHGQNWEILWEKAFQQWNDQMIIPIQLALEIVSNLVSSLYQQQQEEDCEDDNDYQGRTHMIMTGNNDDDSMDNVGDSCSVEDMIVDDRQQPCNGDNVNADDRDDDHDTTIKVIKQLQKDSMLLQTIYELVCNLVSPSFWDNRHPTTTTTEFPLVLPNPIRQLGSDLQIKAVVCFNHCLLLSSSSSNTDNDYTMFLLRMWKELFFPTFCYFKKQQEQHQQGHCEKSTIYLFDDDVRDAIITAAISAVRISTTIRRYLLSGNNNNNNNIKKNDHHNEHGIDLLLSILRNATMVSSAIAAISTDSVNTKTDDVGHKLIRTSLDSDCSSWVCDIVRLVGITLSMESSNQYHTHDVNECACRTLLALLSVVVEYECHNTNRNQTDDLSIGNPYTDPPVLMIGNEIFNTLMDIYGNDDCFPDVFDTTNCLITIQRALSRFQKQIRIYATTMNKNENKWMNDERNFSSSVEVWTETANNTSRFIQYKKAMMHS